MPALPRNTIIWTRYEVTYVTWDEKNAQLYKCLRLTKPKKTHKQEGHKPI